MPLSGGGTSHEEKRIRSALRARDGFRNPQSFFDKKSIPNSEHGNAGGVGGNFSEADVCWRRRVLAIALMCFRYLILLRNI